MGGRVSRERAAWESMLDRCTNPRNRNWNGYGGRGITVCERWLVFASFFEDMGPRPSPQHSLDRIDNDGHYAPGNCRWASPKQQANNRRDTQWLEHNGKRMPITQWAEALGFKEYKTLVRRLDKGWSVERALQTPVRKWTCQRDS